jgi:hypothetical protein
MQTFSLAMFTAEAVVLTLAVAFVVAYAQATATRYSATVTDAVIWERGLVWRLVGVGAVLGLLGLASLVLSLPPPHPIVPPLGRDASRDAVATFELVAVIGSAVVVAFMITRLRRAGNPYEIASRTVSGITAEHMAVVALQGDASAPARRVRPLLGIYELCHQAVVDGDRVTLQCAIDALVAQWYRWITEAPEGRKRADELLSDVGESPMVTRHVVDQVLLGLDEVIALRGLPSQHQVALPQIVGLARKVAPTHANSAGVLLDYLVRVVVGLLAAGVDAPLAPVIEGLFSMETETRQDANLNARVHQVLGSVAQAVPLLFPKATDLVVDGPGFAYHDPARSPVFDALSDGFWQMVFEVEEHPEQSPRDYIWVEAMGAFAVALLKRSAEKALGHTFQDAVSSLIDGIVKATTAAAKASPGDDRPTQVGLIVLRRVHDGRVPETMNEAWSALCEGALWLGAAVLQGGGGLDGSHEVGRAMELIADAPNEALQAAAEEMTMRSGLDGLVGHDSSWAMVRRVGVTRGTNFGMRFNPTTGEPYTN